MFGLRRTVLALSLVVAGCTPDKVQGPNQGPSYAVAGAPAAVNASLIKLDFLPPTVPGARSFAGTFVSDADPVATIVCVNATGPACPRLAWFARLAPGAVRPRDLTGRIEVNLATQAYVASWATPKLQTGPNRYRLQVTLQGAVLADMPLWVVGSAGDLGAIPASYLGLVNKSKWVIAFRLESVAAPVATIDLAPAASNLAAGQTVQLVPTLKDGSGNVLAPVPLTWSSSAPNVATVASDGMVTAVGLGTATISASLGSVTGTAQVTVAPPGDQLPGQPNSPAVTAFPLQVATTDLTTYQTGNAVLSGARISINTVRLAIDRNATVVDINTLLSAFQAKILGGVPGVSGKADGLLVLELPTHSHAEREAVLALMRQRPGVVRASIDVALDGTVTTDAVWAWEVIPTGTNYDLELMRVPQAWNMVDLAARSGARTRTGVLDTGFFPHADLSLTDLTPGVVGDHGTHVAGTIGATFNNGAGIDGVNPFADLVVAGGVTTATMVTRMGNLIVQSPRVRVLNLSLGYNWHQYQPQVNASTDFAAQGVASDDGADVELILHAMATSGYPLPYIFAAAGNDSHKNGNGDQPAEFASPFANAALLQGVRPIVVVEAIDQSMARASFSNLGGQLSAPGVNILSTTSSGVDFKSGTSMATPHLTGLASYVLSVDQTFPNPTLTTNPMFDLMNANTRQTTGAAAPMVDALATVMDLDRVQGGDRILRGLLDLDDGSADGNLRARADGTIETGEDLDGDSFQGDGQIDMSDFRRFRDWLLYTEVQATLVLDGGSFHPKRDVNRDGFIFAPRAENVYSRADFNGDGILDRSAKAQMRGALAGQNLTDLEVLQSRFSDPNYQASALPNLLNSGDVQLDLSACAALPGVASIGLQARVRGQANSIHNRIVAVNQPIQVVTLPADPAGYTVQVRARDAAGTGIIATDEMDVPMNLGEDTHFVADCRSLRITSLSSLGSIQVGQTRTADFRVEEVDLTTGAVTAVNGATVQLTGSGVAANPSLTFTNSAGDFATDVTRNAASAQLTVRAVHPSGSFRQVTFTIGGIPSLQILSIYSLNGGVGLQYRDSLVATGGVGGYVWSVASGTLPPGVSLSANGILSGTATTAGGYSFTVQVQSGAQTDQQPLHITIYPANAWVGGWQGTLTQPNGTVLVANWTVISNGVPLRYVIPGAAGSGCLIIVAANNQDFTGGCTSPFGGGQTFSGVRAGTTITATIAQDLSNPNLPYGQLRLTKWY